MNKKIITLSIIVSMFNISMLSLKAENTNNELNFKINKYNPSKPYLLNNNKIHNLENKVKTDRMNYIKEQNEKIAKEKELKKQKQLSVESINSLLNLSDNEKAMYIKSLNHQDDVSKIRAINQDAYKLNEIIQKQIDKEIKKKLDELKKVQIEHVNKLDKLEDKIKINYSKLILESNNENDVNNIVNQANTYQQDLVNKENKKRAEEKRIKQLKELKLKQKKEQELADFKNQNNKKIDSMKINDSEKEKIKNMINNLKEKKLSNEILDFFKLKDLVKDYENKINGLEEVSFQHKSNFIIRIRSAKNENEIKEIFQQANQQNQIAINQKQKEKEAKLLEKINKEKRRTMQQEDSSFSHDKQIALSCGIKFNWPSNVHDISWGVASHIENEGIKAVDIAPDSNDNNQPVLSSAKGIVDTVKKDKLYGNMVIIKHPNNMYTRYGHLSRIDVKEGDTVVSNQKIGIIGTTGNSTGIHLHFEIMDQDVNTLNPMAFLD